MFVHNYLMEKNSRHEQIYTVYCKTQVIERYHRLLHVRLNISPPNLITL